VEFPPPIGAKNWPDPRGDLYPMKPWDRMLPDGQIESDALGRVKSNQHVRRSVIQWTGGRWVVVRLPSDRDRRSRRDLLTSNIRRSGSPCLLVPPSHPRVMHGHRIAITSGTHAVGSLCCTSTVARPARRTEVGRVEHGATVGTTDYVVHLGGVPLALRPAYLTLPTVTAQYIQPDTPIGRRDQARVVGCHTTNLRRENSPPSPLTSRACHHPPPAIIEQRSALARSPV
jgi:hypothetical protein